ncbi:hypothetical protein ACE193_25550 (plasmid) [Bernardetia sp. OM2101]
MAFVGVRATAGVSNNIICNLSVSFFCSFFGREDSKWLVSLDIAELLSP